MELNCVSSCFKQYIDDIEPGLCFLPSGPSNYNGMAVFDCVPAKGVIGPGKPFQTVCGKSTAAY